MDTRAMLERCAGIEKGLPPAPKAMDRGIREPWSVMDGGLKPGPTLSRSICPCGSAFLQKR